MKRLAVGPAPDRRVLEILARDALAMGEEERALAEVRSAAGSARTDPILWQWTALLLRGLDRRVEALEAMRRASHLAPGNGTVAHGLARILLEAGLPSVDAFAAARRLRPNDAEVISGQAAGLLAAGEVGQAERCLEQTIVRHPGWIAGHEQLARLRWQMGDRDGFVRSLDAAIAGAPRDPALWGALLILLIHAERFTEARGAAARARAAAGESAMIVANDASAASEMREDDDAERLFGELRHLNEPSLVARHMRHLLRTGRPRAALGRGEATVDATLLWPYRTAAWRLLGDARAEWFEGDPRLIGVYDIADALPPIDRLATLLRGLHVARAQQLDQSVRGGTQTDGALLARIEPEIVGLRRAIAAAVERHIAQLPPRDGSHPTLAPRRDRPVRFAGSWSVRLHAAGHHANHVHPAGWLSSALYVSLPPAGEPGDGWLALGAPQAELGLGLAPVRRVEPKPGRLVLFPSTMWHGTAPFAEGERLTVAFDVAAPLGS